VTELESRWDAPVVYLCEYPLVGEFGPRGVPFYLCERCESRLDLVPGGGDAGAMFVCVYGCGQRYWIDKDG